MTLSLPLRLSTTRSQLKLPGMSFWRHITLRLSIAHIQRAMDILSNHLETREDASEYLDEDQIDLLKVPRGYPAHSAILQDGYRVERDLSIK